MGTCGEDHHKWYDASISNINMRKCKVCWEIEVQRKNEWVKVLSDVIYDLNGCLYFIDIWEDTLKDGIDFTEYDFWGFQHDFLASVICYE